jgi:hypothetical protein
VTDAATIEALAGVGSEERRRRGRSARASTSLAPAVLPPGERNNSHPGPAVSVDQLLAEINLDLAPPKAPVNRGLPGVGSNAPLMPNNSRPGPAQPISAPEKRRPAPSQRPVPPSVSGPIRQNGHGWAAMSLRHGVHEDPPLALLRHVIADG